MIFSSKNPPGSALMVTMALMGILSLMMILLLEKIIPTSQATRGIENSTVALYHSSSSIEKAFSTLNYKTPGKAEGNGILPLTKTQEEGKYSIVQESTMIPIPGKGNSEYDSNWNKISSGNPVQLKIDQSFITDNGLSTMVFDLRIPKLGSSDEKAGKTSSTTYFTGSTTFGVVSVILSNGKQTFSSTYGTGCILNALAQNNGITADKINNPDSPLLSQICVKDITDTGTTAVISAQPSIMSGMFCISGCTLKFSLINKLESAAGKPFPYLEYRIRRGTTPLGSQADVCFQNYPPSNTCNSNTMDLPTTLPLPFTTVTAEGIAYGFQRTNTRNLLQLTTSEELDFAVFQ